MNTQIGIQSSDFSFTSLAAAQYGEVPDEIEFVDFLLLFPFTQNIENLTAARFESETIATPILAPQSSLELSGSPQQHFAETGNRKPTNLTQQEFVEPGRKSPNNPSFDLPVETVHQSPQPDTTSVGNNKVRELLSASVSRQTITAIENSIIRSTPPSVQSITVEIHPRDLGQLNIQIEVVADSIQARIVASETLSAELLNKNKDELVNALSEFGYSQTDVDISHQNSGSQQSWDEDHATGGSVFVGQNTFSSTIDVHSHPALLVGVDLVA